MPFRSVTILLLVSTLLWLGCEESVNPKLSFDRPFSIWGQINVRTDTHAVRIFEIQESIRLVQPDPLDAVVSSTNLQTGETLVWRDSVVQLLDGDYRHVFWTVFETQTGQTYRLEVARSDGAVSTAETTIPPIIMLEFIETDIENRPGAMQSIKVNGLAPSLPRIDVEYNIVSITPQGGIVFDNPIIISYADRPRQIETGWIVDIDLVQDFVTIYQYLDELDLSTSLIEVREMQIRVHVGDEKWRSPIGIFDSDFLVEPGIFSNVENGFGFFGAGYVDSLTFRPPDALLDRAGFYAGEDF